MRATISILTYSALGCAKRCIASVLEHSSDFDLILTANGNPEAAEYFLQLAKRHLNIRVLINSNNLGFIEPNREALAITGTPFFILLNDDTLVCPGWLDKLREEFAERPKAALAGPRSRCTSLNAHFIGIPGYRLEYLEGSCLMARTEIVKQFGLFASELKFAYGEDSDLSLRMREAGFTIHQAPFTLPFHAGGATTRTVPEVKKHFHANHLYLRARWKDYLATTDRKFPCER